MSHQLSNPTNLGRRAELLVLSGQLHEAAGHSHVVASLGNGLCSVTHLVKF